MMIIVFNVQDSKDKVLDVEASNNANTNENSNTKSQKNARTAETAKVVEKPGKKEKEAEANTTLRSSARKKPRTSVTPPVNDGRRAKSSRKT